MQLHSGLHFEFLGYSSKWSAKCQKISTGEILEWKSVWESYARKGRFVLLERPFYAGTSAFWLFVLLEDTDEEVRNAAWESTSLLWELEFCFLTYVEELLAYSKLVCLKIVFGPGFRHSVSFYLDADSFKSTSFLVSGCSWCGKNSRMLNSLGSFCRELNLEINRWF